MTRKGTARDATGRDATGRDGTSRAGTGHEATGSDGTSRAGARRAGARQAEAARRPGGDERGQERVVRPYAVTAGRTRPSGAAIDLVALVSAMRGAGLSDPDGELGPEHLRLLRFCRLPVSVADLATTLDLPLGVARILIADLRDLGLVSIYQPARAGLTDVRILKEVADGLRRL